MSNAKIYRDVYEASFAGTTIYEVVGVRVLQRARIIEASAEDDAWIDYVGVAKGRVEVIVEHKDAASLKQSGGGFDLGDRGTLSFKERSDSAAGGVDVVTHTLSNCTLVGVERIARHAETADTRLRFLAESTDGATNPHSVVLS